MCMHASRREMNSLLPMHRILLAGVLILAAFALESEREKRAQSAVCNPRCGTGFFHAAGSCQSNGRCLCWWGFTGPNAEYIVNGKLHHRILADYCNELCFYIHIYYNLKCASLPETPFYVISDSSKLQRFDMTTGKSRLLQTIGSGVVSSLDFDVTSARVFYGNNATNTITSSGITESSTSKTIVSGIQPQAVAVDWLKRKIYWTNGATDEIERSNLDGTVKQTVQNGSNLRGLAVDPTTNNITTVLYWSEWTSNPAIQKAVVVDQSGVPSVQLTSTIVSSNMSEPLGFVIDFVLGTLYWADPGKQRVESVNLDGSNRVTVFQSSSEYPSYVTHFQSKVIWTALPKSVNSLDISSSVKQLTLSGLGTTPSAITVYHSTRQPSYNVDDCSDQNGGCTDSCVDTPASYICRCPSGFALSDDSLSCKDINECLDENLCDQTCFNLYGSFECVCLPGYKWKSQRRACVVSKAKVKFLLANEKEIGRINDNNLNTYHAIPMAQNLKNASAVDYHYKRDEVYWSDTTEHTITRSSLLTGNQNQNVIIDSNLGQVEGIAIDWVNNKLYWTDRKNGTIERSSLDGQNREIILSNLGDVVAIALDPLNDRLYYSVLNAAAYIGQAALNGSGATSFVSAVSTPISLSVDVVRDRLYWGDATSKQIEYVSLNGSGRTVVYINTDGIQSLSVFEDRVLFVDGSLSTICYVNKFTGDGRSCHTMSSSTHIRDVKIVHFRNQQSTGCPTGKYDVANSCTKDCKCQHGLCDPIDGNCTCDSGYTGQYCDQVCSTGKYGADCDEDCVCKNQGDCSHVTGECTCPNGYRSYDCSEQCDPKSPNCVLCSCLNGGVCGSDGSCVCKSGYDGSLCENQTITAAPQTTTAAPQTTTAAPQTTTAVLVPHTGTAAPETVCPTFTFGSTCSQTCDCSSNSISCNDVSGQCNCAPGYEGLRCEKACPHSSFGDACGQQCTCQNGAECDHVTGDCSCTPGWTGNDCDDECPEGTFGSDCLMECSCLNGATCDREQGICSCTPDYTGANCETHITYDTLPSPSSSAQVENPCLSSFCLNGGSCEVQLDSPVCTCTIFWTGDQCKNPRHPECLSEQTEEEILQCFEIAESKARDSQSSNQQVYIVIGVVILIAIVILIVAFVYYRYKKRSKMHTSEDGDTLDKKGTVFQNPAYDELPAIPQKTSSESGANLDNPLYSDVIDIPTSSHHKETGGYDQPRQLDYEQPAQFEAVATVDDPVKKESNPMNESGDTISSYDNKVNTSSNQNPYDNQTSVECNTSASASNVYDNYESIPSQQADGSVNINDTPGDDDLYEELP